MQHLLDYRKAILLLESITPRGGYWVSNGTGSAHWRNWAHDADEDRARTIRMHLPEPHTIPGARDTPFDLSFAAASLSYRSLGDIGSVGWDVTVHLFGPTGLVVREHGLHWLRALASVIDVAGPGPWVPPVTVVQSWYLAGDQSNQPSLYVLPGSLPPIPPPEVPSEPAPVDPGSTTQSVAGLRGLRLAEGTGEVGGPA